MILIFRQIDMQQMPVLRILQKDFSDFTSNTVPELFYFNREPVQPLTCLQL